MPGAIGWLLIAASVALHIGYRLFLVKAYETGDLAQTYPLARGAAPLLTTLGGIVLIREIPAGLAILGILLLSAGTLLMSMRGGNGLTVERRAIGFAFITSLFVAGYTLTDGMGARSADGGGELRGLAVRRRCDRDRRADGFRARSRHRRRPCCRNGGPG